jgi:anti-sigma regulatory factor (Ser/Thr protein kinase)
VSDVVTLQLPRDRDFFGVAHLVLGGLGARFDVTYDVLDDITTALDELMDRHEAIDEVTLEVEVGDGEITTIVGPFTGRVIDELHASDAGLGLRRVLETVVDKVSVTERDGGHWVELRKHMEAVPHAG